MTSDKIASEDRLSLLEIFQPGFTFMVRKPSETLAAGRVVMVKRVDETATGAPADGSVHLFGCGCLDGATAIQSLQQVTANPEF